MANGSLEEAFVPIAPNTLAPAPVNIYFEKSFLSDFLMLAKHKKLVKRAFEMVKYGSMLNQDEVKHIADLARIELTEEEEKKYQEQLGRILDYVNKLSEAKTEGVVTADGGTIGLENGWREDEIRDKELETRDKGSILIDTAPEIQNRQIKVKSVF